MKRLLVYLMLMTIALVPSRAETTKAEGTYFVVFNSLTKKCTVVEKMPQTDTPSITLATDAIYETRAEAEAAIKTLNPCHE
jgi:hypothetical protein